MNNPLKKFRKLFVKPKRMNATAVRNTAASSHDEETDDTKLSGAFVVVLILHIVAVVGIVAFTRIKESRRVGDQAAIMDSGSEKKKDVAINAATAATPSNKLSQLAPEAPLEHPVVENNPPRPQTSTGAQTHTVKQGETLTKIAMAFGTTVPEIVRANQLKGVNEISIGQVLNIPDRNAMPPLPAMQDKPKETVKNSPPKPSTPSSTKTSTGSSYTIKKGDSLMKIARDHSISYEALVKVNKGVDPKKIQPGQVLKIPAKN
jgi:LysM repeat protein